MNCKLCGHPATDHIDGTKSIVGVIMCVEDKCNCHLTQSDVEAQTNKACSGLASRSAFIAGRRSQKSHITLVKARHANH